MKRLFIILSNLLVGLFIVWVFTVWSFTFVSQYFPYIAVLDASPEAEYSKVTTGLTQLAEKTDSVIAIQHQEFGENGTPVVTYTVFGEGELPAGLSSKKIEDPSSISVETNYFIFKGDLRIEQLKEELSQLGMTRMAEDRPSFWGVLISVFGSGFQLLGLLIFLLTFGSLSLIRQIRTLRTAGIRLISGENRWKIFSVPLKEDILYFGVGILLSLALVSIVGMLYSFPPLAFYMIGVGILSYNIILLLISLFFACLFATGVKKVHLMQIIKGQFPVRGIISLILIGQFLAVLIVSVGVSHTLVYSQAWKQQEQGEIVWSKENDLIRLSAARQGMDIGLTEAGIAKRKVWYRLMDQAVTNHSAVLSRHYLSDRELGSGLTSSIVTTSSIWNDYSPQGNVLLVTPQYLIRQKVEVDSAISQKINQLSLGEFVLLLPDTLESDAEQYKNQFEKSITELVSLESHQEMLATVSYIKTGKDRFVYNTSPISYQQFLRDPIIVVLTPKSTGEGASIFWESNLQDYFLFDNLENTQTLITENELGHWVSELKTGNQAYQTLLSNLQREVWSMIAGAVLAIATSILMFNTTNLLYFEEFRRNLFIKRVSGLTFFEIHKNYLLAQSSIFLLGFLASVFLTQNVLVCLIVFSLFLGNSILLLQLQMKKENKMSTLILKGA